MVSANLRVQTEIWYDTSSPVNGVKVALRHLFWRNKIWSIPSCWSPTQHSIHVCKVFKGARLWAIDAPLQFGSHVVSLQSFDPKPTLVRTPRETHFTHAGWEMLEDMAVAKVFCQTLLDALIAPGAEQHLSLLDCPVNWPLSFSFSCLYEDTAEYSEWQWR